MKKLITLRLPAILASLILIAGLISLTWESGTSYDDGGLGTFSFIILMPIMILRSLIKLPVWVLVPTISVGLFYLDYFLNKRLKNKE
ncbi:hypothetical protein MKZ42_17835 [Pseudoalteromonas shioyasakiensis]|uniref:Uncharacterized protein n=1 Tax=Pseudoalteromonas shioyasakiensis TaxID=1190813 RepID=A0ABT6U1Z3_9GAMM|nr:MULTISPECIES: hypothetical protein [Pseudoalteromonas]MCZ4252248.1 hypothetical protein [Pseudoalteromonas shioyasakiensis]MDI4670194.1 hypothetical protein [Pseudoalteromonas shioyasakiensis]MDI4675109.1 hypothetical protein [Pseudoalteromonas shioyasakiensis]MDI4686857.1 hypothetical protein [Pseudoalteromonas shioyasakiensis]MDI4705452.1 hypothetical protein [Pseudoalteromonas shioyasakiensis]|tara:strand:- start:2145 stop:2405 length:261 start_codon:yes stop_codon:yes gene_type:complete